MIVTLVHNSINTCNRYDRSVIEGSSRFKTLSADITSSAMAASWTVSPREGGGMQV